MWQRTLLPIFIAGSGSLTAALSHFSYFCESYLIPWAQNSKKVFMVLIQQCCSWPEWLCLECSAIPGMTRCNLYDQCIFGRPSLDRYSCGSRLWEMESTSNIKNIWPPSHTHLLLSGRWYLFVSALHKRSFILKLCLRRTCKRAGGLNIQLQ